QRRWHWAKAVLAFRHHRGADCDKSIVFVLHLVVEDRAPEPGETAGIGTVDRKLGELAGHVSISCPHYRDWAANRAANLVRSFHLICAVGICTLRPVQAQAVGMVGGPQWLAGGPAADTRVPRPDGLQKRARLPSTGLRSSAPAFAGHV